MNKFNQKIHNYFVSGAINGAIYEYLQKIADTVDDNDIDIFDQHIVNLVHHDIKTFKDCEAYFYVLACVSKKLDLLIGKQQLHDYMQKLCTFILANKDNYNFSNRHVFLKLGVDFLKENYDLLKKSYPNNMGVESSGPIRQYNVDKWIETMRYIYEAANTNNLLLDSVTQQVITQWDENEKINFQRWMKYYQEGNYNKYNVKTAQFFSNKPDALKTHNLNGVKELLDSSAFPKPDPGAEKRKKLDDARKKLRGRLKSVLELLDQYRDVLPRQDNDAMRKDVYDLNERVWNLELKASVVDSIIRTSNQFNKRGFSEGAGVLRKIAQEVAEDKLPVPVPQAAPVKQEESMALPQETPEDTVKVPPVNIGEDAIEIPDFSSATHRDALQKLEQINKVISERNVVRALAAVDIILGQLGIASYFPALSEAQSKLMDAFNYAGTRVAEVIGQMRGGEGVPLKVEKKPKPETVEVAEEINKPVGEVLSGSPEQKIQPAQVSKIK